MITGRTVAIFLKKQSFQATRMFLRKSKKPLHYERTDLYPCFLELNASNSIVKLGI